MVSLILLLVFHKSDLVVENIQKDVPPGGHRAILTLANGQRIDLAKAAKGNLAIQGNSNIIKNGSGQVIYLHGPIKSRDGQPGNNKVSTPDGGTWQVCLPDGTMVWLNNSSSLTYPTTFEGRKQRGVELYGEAYFEVAKDKRYPFVVKSPGQEVTVLGTHFNIRVFKDDGVGRTTLLEGKVSITSYDKQDAQILKPGEQARISNGSMTIGKVNINDAIAWKDGYFRFTNTPIEQVMRELSRWYGIEVHYDGPIPMENFNGKISRLKNISKVLVALEATKTVHFKVEGRRVTVMK
ncbi:FecR family protein [Mucilaginibacter sp. P25]|uniref:FecR family protein n=1 Tax=Mucilaginibacter sp. P25 TaxID=3423945 RepID=UPI003D792E6E